MAYYNKLLGSPAQHITLVMPKVVQAGPLITGRTQGKFGGPMHNRGGEKSTFFIPSKGLMVLVPFSTAGTSQETR